MKMTGREQKLLIILGIISLIAVTYYVAFTPLKAKYDITREQLKVKRTEYKNAQLNIDSIDSLKVHNEKLKADADKIAQSFFTTRQEDLVVTANLMMQRSGLGFSGASFKLVDMKPVYAKTEEKAVASYPLKDIAASINNIISRQNGIASTVAKKTPPAKTEVCDAFKINISFKDTSYEQLLAFLRECENLNKLFKINTITVTQQQQINSGSIDMDMYTAPSLGGG